jgi:hypothetical protein
MGHSHDMIEQWVIDRLNLLKRRRKGVGKVHGKTIELDEDLGVAEGQEVEVQVKIISPKKRLPGPPPGWQPGSKKTAACLLAGSWTEEDDRILEEIHQDRKRGRYRGLSE